MTFIKANNDSFRYTGRNDFSNPSEPTIIHAGNEIHVRFSGTRLALRIRNHHTEYENAIGFLIDGTTEGKTVLATDDALRDYPVAENLPQGMHELILWKRIAAGCHYFDFHGILIDDGAEVAPSAFNPSRRIECYGDSVSAGEVCEAVEYTEQMDPENHEGKFSNSRYSYSMMTARNLGAEIWNTAQGGIAILDNTGFYMGGTVGLVTTWDKLRMNPRLGPYTPWDFSRFTPHVVIMAISQNDKHPEDYINTDPIRRSLWIATYAGLMRKLRSKYPRALFVVISTLLHHDAGWDVALDEMTASLRDFRVVRYRFKRNGIGTPGHLRISENAEMAGELTAFLQSFGDSLWNEQ